MNSVEVFHLGRSFVAGLAGTVVMLIFANTLVQLWPKVTQELEVERTKAPWWRVCYVCLLGTHGRLVSALVLIGLARFIEAPLWMAHWSLHPYESFGWLSPIVSGVSTLLYAAAAVLLAWVYHDYQGEQSTVLWKMTALSMLLLLVMFFFYRWLGI